MFAVILITALVSCTSNEDVVHPSVQYSNGTLDSLAAYNLKMLDKTSFEVSRSGSKSRGKWADFFPVCSKDILGAAAGIGAGQKIAAFLGAATGGTGYVATCVVCGALCSAGASYEQYKKLRGCQVAVNNLPSDGPLFRTSCTMFEVSAKFDYLPSNQYAYNILVQKINLPKSFEYLKDIGENHNGVIRTTIFDDVSIPENVPTTRGGIGGPTTNPVKPADPGTWFPPKGYNHFTMDKLVTSDTLKNVYNMEIHNVQKANSDEELYSDINSENVKDALKLYMDLYANFPNKVEDIIVIVNGYIDIIEANKDFSYEDKEAIYSALIVSLYSPQLWEELKQYGY